MENFTESMTGVSKLSDNTTMTTPTRRLYGVQALRDPFQAVVVLVHATLCLFIMTGNALTIVAVWSTKSLRTIQNKYIVALALVDFSVGFIFVEMLIQYYIKDSQTAHECWFYLAILYSSFIYSLIIMLSVAIDRYLYIARPFFYVKHVTGTRARLVLITEGVVAYTGGCSASFMGGVEGCNPFFIFNNKMMRYLLPQIFLAVGIVIGITYGRIACMAKLCRDQKIRRLLVINQVLATNKSSPKTSEHKKKGFLQQDKVSDNESIVEEPSISSDSCNYKVKPGNNVRGLGDQRKVSVTGGKVLDRDSSKTVSMGSGQGLKGARVLCHDAALGLTNPLKIEESGNKGSVKQTEMTQCDCEKSLGGYADPKGSHAHRPTELYPLRLEPRDLLEGLTDQRKIDPLKELLEQRRGTVDSGAELRRRSGEYCDNRSARSDRVTESMDLLSMITDQRKEYIDHHDNSVIAEQKMESVDQKPVVTDHKADYLDKCTVLSGQCAHPKAALSDPESLPSDQSTSLQAGPNPWSLSSLRWMKQMVVVFGLFVLSWMPIMIYVHMAWFITLDYRLAYVLSSFSIASSGVNFFVYSYFNKNFRVVLKRRLRCHCKN